MNKKLFLSMFAAAGMLLATSCSNDELDVVQSGNEAQVTFSLAAVGDGTVLTLEHLPVLEQFVRLNAMGWHTFLDMVAAAVRGGPVEGRDTYMKANARRYNIDLANPLG